MRKVDLQNWPRQQHFLLFRAMDIPYFNITANLDMTAFYRFVKEREHPFFLSFLYLILKTAHEIGEFRTRIRGDEVVEHETVGASITVMTAEEVFGFCTVEYDEDFRAYLGAAALRVENAKKEADLADEPGRDDLIYVTNIPWVAFTGISHPMHLHPADSIPRFACGKYFYEGDRLRMPISVQAHHGLADGEHVGRFFNRIQSMLDHPAEHL